jgi:type IV secretory pathway VirJ component
MIAWVLAAAASLVVETSRGAQPLAVYAPAAPTDRPLVLVLSGEGGWRAFDDKLARWMAAAGYPVGGFDAMKYFWTAQDDREALAADVRLLVAALEKSAGRAAGSKVVFVGFSFGADLAPWIAGAGGWGERLAGMVLLGPDATGSLEFRVSEMLGFGQTEHVFDVAAALRSCERVPKVFLHGGSDRESAAPALHAAAPGAKRLLTIDGADLHFNGKDDALRRALLEALEPLGR